MGCCGSSDGLTPEQRAKREAAQKTDMAVDSHMNKAHEADSMISKLLLLGAGESGKSTLFKQMITIYGKGFPETERNQYTKIIHSNVVLSMKTLIKESKRYGEISQELEADRQLVEAIPATIDTPVDTKIGLAVKALWTDKAIQATYAARSHFQLIDSAKYYFDRIDAVAAVGYVPSQDDVLRSRAPTTGIVENDFTIEGARFNMFDVGGQRNERKKWIHCFERVTAVLYVAAISEYDQLCMEDDKTNRMVEAFNVFDENCNSQWFKRTAVILFLNKRDIFQEKVKTVSIKQYLSEFEGKDNDYDSGVSWFQKQFLLRNKRPEKAIYCHVTCATDTNNVRAVFNAVKDIINKQALEDAGMGPSMRMG